MAGHWAGITNYQMALVILSFTLKIDKTSVQNLPQITTALDFDRPNYTTTVLKALSPVEKPAMQEKEEELFKAVQR